MASGSEGYALMTQVGAKSFSLLMKSGDLHETFLGTQRECVQAGSRFLRQYGGHFLPFAEERWGDLEPTESQMKVLANHPHRPETRRKASALIAYKFHKREFVKREERHATEAPVSLLPRFSHKEQNTQTMKGLNMSDENKDALTVEETNEAEEITAKQKELSKNTAKELGISEIPTTPEEMEILITKLMGKALSKHAGSSSVAFGEMVFNQLGELIFTKKENDTPRSRATGYLKTASIGFGERPYRTNILTPDFLHNSLVSSHLHAFQRYS